MAHFAPEGDRFSSASKRRSEDLRFRVERRSQRSGRKDTPAGCMRARPYVRRAQPTSHSPTSVLIYASSFVYSFSDYTSYSFSSSGLRFKRKLVHHFRFRSRGALPPSPQIQNGSTQIGVLPFCIGGGDGT